MQKHLNCIVLRLGQCYVLEKKDMALKLKLRPGFWFVNQDK